MSQITTSGILPAPIEKSFGKKLLAVPVPKMIHNIPADLKQMPRNGGSIMRMRRYSPLATATVPLGNSGIHPPAQQLSAVDIDAKMDFYGSYVVLNEQVELQNQDPVLNQATKRLGVALRQTEDELTRNMLASTASFINCVGGTNGDNPTWPARSDIHSVTETLEDNDAYMISDGIEGEDRFGTAPVRDAYFAMGNSRLISDLELIDGFIPKAQYPNQDRTLRSEWGSVSNMRFLLSSIGSFEENASLNGNRVYNIFVTGLEAYGVIEQDGYSAQFIYRPPIYDGPLALNASVGFKFAQVPRIYNDAWVINMRCTKRS